MRVPLPETIRVNAMWVPSGDGTGHQSNGAGGAAAAGTAKANAAAAASSVLTPDFMLGSYAAGIKDR